MFPGKKYYEKYARTYPDDLVIRGTQIAAIKKFLKVKGKIGLDVGSANGALAMELAKLGAKKIYGIDIADSFITAAKKDATRQKVKNVSFQQADANVLPFPDNHFDFITCTEVLEHVPGFQKAIKEIYRVLKPGGQFAITVPNTLCPAEMLHQAKHYLMYALTKDPITHINLFFLPTVKKHFSWGKNIKVQPLHFVLPFLPKKYCHSTAIQIDIAAGNILKPIAFDCFITGKK